jgi:hypothetical protein
MRSNLWLPIVALAASAAMSAALPAVASANDSVQCAPNEEKVWVYHSPTDFNVEAKLPCGASVSIVGRVKGYVEIRTASGQQGYVPDEAIPNLPPYVDQDAKSAGTESGMSLGELADKLRHANERQAAATASNVAAAPAVRAAPRVAAPAPVTATAAASDASASMRVVASDAVAAPPPPSPRQAAAAPEAPADITLSNAPEAAARPVAVAQPVAARSAEVVAAAPMASRRKPAASTAKRVAAPAAPKPIPAAPPIVPPAAPAPAANTETAANSEAAPTTVTVAAVDTRPVVAMQPLAKATRAEAAGGDADADLDDDADAAPVESAARPACSAYFSAYGLTPNQYKWIVTERKKKFPGICPAPEPSMVDYVVIFTHDVNFYNYTMPTPVRTDASGLSDWEPMRMVDTAYVSASEADKNRHEYVWVFHTKRGAFDPARFSSRRRPQFAKSESNTFGTHAGDRTAEDALRFIEENGGGTAQ